MEMNKKRNLFTGKKDTIIVDDVLVMNKDVKEVNVLSERPEIETEEGSIHG